MNPYRQKSDLNRLLELLPEDRIETAERLLRLLITGDAPLETGLMRQVCLLESILDSLPDGVLAVDLEGRVTVWNRALEEMTGVRREEMLGRGEHAYSVPFFGRKKPLLVNLLLGECGEEELEYEKMERKGHVLMGERFTPLSGGGEGLYYWACAAPVRDEKGNLLGAVQCIRDIGERKKMEEELKRGSTRDTLTGLYNRAYFEEELRQLEKRRVLPVSLVFCDLDGLKVINDMLGHEQGDELLRRAAGVIARSVRSSDVVARLGGDEFAVILPQTDRTKADEVARRIIDAVEADNTRHPDLPLSISVGVATAIDPSRPLREVYKEADEAMYMNKLAGGRDPRSAVIRTLKEVLAEKEFHRTERMKEVACRLGEALGLSREHMDRLRLLVDVHDIGKLLIPDHILFKTGPLTEEERKQIRRHPEVGYRIAVSSVELAPIAPLILQHHERWDGKGYPQGLRGNEIHLLSRILAIADAFDAMLSERPYRRALTYQETLAELRKGAGTQFDPDLVETFLSLQIRV